MRCRFVRSRWPAAAASLGVMLLVGCGGGRDLPAPEAVTTLDAWQIRLVEEDVGEDPAEAGAEVTSPTGAMPRDAYPSLSPAPEEDPSGVLSAVRVTVPDSYEEPARIAFTGLSEDMEESFVLARKTPDGWLLLTDLEGGSGPVSGALSGSGTYGLTFAEQPGLLYPPVIEGLQVTPDRIAANQESTITVDWSYRYPPSGSLDCTAAIAGVSQKVSPGDEIVVTIEDATNLTVLCASEYGADEASILVQPAVPPVIKAFRASPPYVPGGRSTAVTFTWDYDGVPDPAPTCEIPGVGPVTSGQAVTVNLSTLPNPIHSYTLRCQNVGGEASLSTQVVALLDVPLSIVLQPTGNTFDLFGILRVVVPPGAVEVPTTVTGRLGALSEGQEGLFGPVIEFEPSGIQFQQPIEVTFRYTAQMEQAFAIVDPVAQLGFGQLALSGLLPVEASVDREQRTITGKVHHFSSYAPVSRPVPGTPLFFEKTSLARHEEAALFLPFTDDVAYRFPIASDPEYVFLQGEKVRVNLEPHEETGAVDLGDAPPNFGCDGTWLDVETGDVDGDGRDEVVALCRTGSGRGRDLDLRVYSWQDGQWERIASRTASDGLLGLGEAPMKNDDAYYDGDIALGNFDSDGAAEIVLLGNYGSYSSGGKLQTKRGAVWGIFELRGNSLVRIWRNKTAFDEEERDDLDVPWGLDHQGRRYRYKNLRVAVGDLNRANQSSGIPERDEIVFVGRREYRYYTEVAEVGETHLVRNYHHIYEVRGYVYRVLSEQQNEQTVITNAYRLHRFDAENTRAGGESRIFRSGEDRAMRPAVIIGDFDGDGIGEIAFAGANSSGNAYVEIYEGNTTFEPHGRRSWIRTHQHRLARSEKTAFPVEFDEEGVHFSWGDDKWVQQWDDRIAPKLAVGDVMAAHRDTLFLLLADRNNDGKRWLVSCYPSTTGDGATSRVVDTAPRSRARMAVGDLDNDGFDELLLLYASKYGNKYWMARWAHDPSRDSGTRFHRVASRRVYSGDVGSPLVALGDFDGDNTLVEFVRNASPGSDQSPLYEVGTSHPVVETVLRPPPYWAALIGTPAQDASAITEIELLAGGGQSTTVSTGMSVEVSVMLGGDVAGFGGGLGVGLETGLTRSRTEGYDYQSGAGLPARFPEGLPNGEATEEDVVLFREIPYHVFWYRVLQHPDANFRPGSARCAAQPHPYTGAPDDFCYMAVNVPTWPARQQAARLNEYNDRADAEGFPRIDIGYPASFDLVTHPAGNPRAYPDSDAALALARRVGGTPLVSSSVWSTDMDTSLPIRGIIQLSEFLDVGEEETWSAKVFVKLKTPIFEFERTWGVHGAYSVTITQQSTLKYWGFVPPLSCRNACFDLQASQAVCPSACHDALVDGTGQPLPEADRPVPYSWGMFLRDGTDTGDEPSTFPVLDYFVMLYH